MSHFTCLVVTSEEPTDEVLEKALLPFHEYECTAIKEYTEVIDITSETLEDYHKADKTEYPSFESALNGYFEYKFWNGTDEQPGFNWYTIDDKLNIKVFRRTNPNAKWDWYNVGGRWAGSLIHKRLGKVNKCLKSLLDIPAMQQMRAQARKDRIAADAKQCDISLDQFTQATRFYWSYHEVWLALEDRPRGEDFRIAFHNWLPDAHKYASRLANLWDVPKIPESTLEEYYNNAQALTTYAVLYNGKWFARGEMGWWGISTNDDDKWDANYNEMLTLIPDDHYVTVVDCHI